MERIIGRSKRRRIRTAKRICSAVLIFVLTLTMIPLLQSIADRGLGAFAAPDKLQIVGTPTVYVQSGNDAVVSIKVRNNSGGELRGVNLAQGMASMDDYDNFCSGLEYSFTDGSSERSTLDPIYGGGEENTWYRFSSYFEKDKAAVNAVWDSSEEGYTIAKDATATLWFKVHSEYEEPDTYSEWIRLGNVHSELYGGFYPVTVVDEDYSGRMTVKVVTYNPSGAAITLGTSSNHGRDISAIAPGSAIDFGTVDVSKSTGLTAERTYYTRNTSTGYGGDITQDEHGASTDIRVDLSVETPLLVQWSYDHPIGCNSNLTSGMNWAPLPAAPMTSNTWQAAQTGITLDASNFIAGTYTGEFTLTTVPHGVSVNGSAVNTNGIYTWPVKVTLTGNNPRVPQAPTDLTATPGNGQVEITWKAAAGSGDSTEYSVYRRQGAESSSGMAKLSTAQFNWADYEFVGSDIADEDGNCLFVDGTAVNGTTYTYVVIGGTPFQAYPAISSAVKPLKTYSSKLLAPDLDDANSETGGVLLCWRMNESYGGRDNDGSSMVDHFNVYRDGVLVAQVQQNAVTAVPVIENGEYPPGSGIYTDYVARYEYEWEYLAETPSDWQPYTFNVAAVSKSGVEGYWSDSFSGYSVTEIPCITAHRAVYDAEYYDDTGSGPAISIYLTMSDGNYVEKLTFWRSVGTSAPDTGAAPYKVIGERNWGEPDLVDRSVTKGKTYTYTVRGEDVEHNQTDYYTFTVKAAGVIGSDWGEYNSTEVTWSTLGGKKASLQWYYDYSTDDEGEWSYTGTYKVYRNNTVIKTYTASGQTNGSVTYTNDPGADGTYVYRVDKIINGITIRGKDYTFVRNTAAVDESTLLKAPSAPVFDVRISEGNPVLRWAATAGGGEVEGYHIYRRDAGEYVNGYYFNNYGYMVYCSNGRYFSIDDAGVTALTDKYGYYDQDDHTKGFLQGVNWGEEDCPHEYWITAYNQAGESEPSRIVSFDFQGLDEYDYPIPPANTDEYVPAAPVIDRVWIEWEDDSRVEWDEAIGGRLHVAWTDAPATAGSIDQWDVMFGGTSNGSSVETAYSWQAATDPGVTKGTSGYSPTEYVSAGSSDYDDYGRTISITVNAVNSAGSAASEPAYYTVLSLPRFRVNAGNALVKLDWTDLFDDTSVSVESWEIWRMRESGSWQIVSTLDASGLDYEKDSSGGYVTDYRGVKNYTYTDNGVTNGWAYDYKVVAVCDDGTRRESVIREAVPQRYAATEVPGAAQNLRYSVVNGEVLLTWDPPATGDAQRYTVMYEDPSWGWTRAGEVEGPSTNFVWNQNTAGSYRMFVYAWCYINGEEAPQVDIYADEPDDYAPNHSNVITVELTQAQIDQQADDYPGYTTLSARAVEGSIILSWTKSSGATYYMLTRSGGDGGDTLDVTLPASVTSYTDDTVMPGVRYRYIIEPANVWGSSTYSDVYVTAEGRTKDQIIADEVSALIDALPAASAITINNYAEYRQQILDTKAQYDALTAAQQKLISSDNRAKLAACLDKLEQIRVSSEYAEVAEPVQDAINALPAADQITLDDAAAIEAARAEYDALPADAKKLIDTTALTAAEKKLAELRKAAGDRQLVDALLSDLEALISMSGVSADNADAIIALTEALQNRIEALDSDQRALFDAADNAEDLLTKLEETDSMARYLSDDEGGEHKHLAVFTEAVAPTCSSAGHIAGYQCRICGAFFTDSTCTEPVSEEDAVIPADPSAHEWGEWTETVPATCKHTGLETRFCANDPDGHVETRVIGIRSHDWNTEPVSTVTEGNVTTYTYQCRNCDETRTGIATAADEETSCGSHVWNWDEPDAALSTPPTCCEPGRTVYHCANEGCEDTIIEVQEIDPSAHDWGEPVVTPATCTQPGSIVTVCRHNEEHRVEEVIEPLGHDWDEGTVIRRPTCTAAGITQFTCTREGCGETRIEIIPADADAHDWGEWTVFEEATCTSEGLMMRQCLNDPEHVETKAIPKTEHVWGDWEIVYPEAGHTKGSKTRTCMLCDLSETVDVEFSIAKATVTGVSGKNYTGKAVTQSPKVVLDGVTLVLNRDYTLSYRNNTRIGTATVVITGKGIYSGSVTKTFDIGPKAASIKNPKGAKKAVTVKWGKMTTKMVLASGKKATITGYQVQISTNKNFTSGVKTYTVKGYKKTSKKITKLKAKTTYYVRVRTYIKVGNKTYYSTWSGVKSAKTK